MHSGPALRTALVLNRPRWIALFFVVLAIQAFATYWSLMHTFGVVVRVLNSGAAASFGDMFVSFGYSVLSFPVFPLVDYLRAGANWFPGIWEPMPFVLNGAVWASAVCWLVRRVRSKRMPPSDDDGDG